MIASLDHTRQTTHRSPDARIDPRTWMGVPAVVCSSGFRPNRWTTEIQLFRAARTLPNVALVLVR